jgi:hypothetical protein
LTRRERRDVQLSFVARREFTLDSSETNVYVAAEPDEDARTVLGEIRGEIRTAKSGEQRSDEGLIDLFLRLPRQCAAGGGEPALAVPAGRPSSRPR